jgi:micrococcal nuclease
VKKRVVSGFLRAARGAVVAALAALWAMTAAAAQAPSLVGKTFDATVVRIADGDSVEIIRTGDRQPFRVRLQGVDAPELGESFSREAQLLLRQLLLDKRVNVSGRDVDRYGRLVARLVIGGQDASHALLAAGLACQRFAIDAALAKSESQARSAGLGFWAAAAAKPQCVARSRGAGAAAGPAVVTPRIPGPRAPAKRNATPSVHVRANVSSGVYHRESCPNFNCSNCTRLFASEAEAKASGFRPAGDCAR